MIAYLQGQVIKISERSLTLQTASIGFEVMVLNNLLSALKLRQDLALQTVLVVKEDAFELYGFTKGEQVELFKQLTKVNRIGSKLAMAILNVASPAKIITAIINGEADFLCLIPGIGRKTAERIIFELKNHLTQPVEALASGAKLKTELTVKDEVTLALTNLGFAPEEINRILPQVLSSPQPQTLSDYIKLALKYINS